MLSLEFPGFSGPRSKRGPHHPGQLAESGINHAPKPMLLRVPCSLLTSQRSIKSKYSGEVPLGLREALAASSCCRN